MNEPSPEVRRELEAILQRDDSRVGQVHRLTAEGLGPPEIARELGVSTSNFVSNARTMARGLLDGYIPSGPAATQQVLSFVRRVAKSPQLSRQARTYLDQQIRQLSEAVGGAPAHPIGPEKPQRHEKGPSSSTSSISSLRSAVEEEVRRRTRELVDRIRDETDIQALDYRGVVASDRPLDAVVRVIRWRGDDGTFDDLLRLGRRDLTLEQAVVTWAADLPLTADLVDEAAARIDWTT